MKENVLCVYDNLHEFRSLTLTASQFKTQEKFPTSPKNGVMCANCRCIYL